jgi:hemin uptake protein HemP
MRLQIRTILNMILPTTGEKSKAMSQGTPENPGPPPADPSNPPGKPVVVDSAALFKGAAEIVIRHGGREYRLRKTRLDKLILTA